KARLALVALRLDVDLFRVEAGEVRVVLRLGDARIADSGGLTARREQWADDESCEGAHRQSSQQLSTHRESLRLSSSCSGGLRPILVRECRNDLGPVMAA